METPQQEIQELFCNKCQTDKPVSDFRKDQHNSTGHNSLCNTCYNQNQVAFRSKNRESLAANAKTYYHNNRERIQQLRKLRRAKKDNTIFFAKTPSKKAQQKAEYYKRSGFRKAKEYMWKKRGIIDFSYDQYEQMYSDQNSCCFLCSKPDTEVGTLHIDHCHTTGKVRKLLCNNCNTGIGKLNEDIELMQKAISYITTHKQ